MDIQTARDITTPPSHRSLTADIIKPFRAPIEHAVGAGYGIALHELDAHAATLRSFLRGMLNAETAKAHIAKARTALDAMERALP